MAPALPPIPDGEPVTAELVSPAPLVDREPVRLAAALAALVLTVGGFLTAWGGGVDWRIALGGALTAGATTLAGGEWARSRAYSPATADVIMDAHAVIARAERTGRG